MDWLSFTLYAIVAVEIVLLLFLYKFVLSKWNADAWEKKVKSDDGDWLVALLMPVIEETVERVVNGMPKELTKVLKGELLASQGSLSRAVFSDQGEPADMMLGLATGILEQLGYRKPSPIMAAKLSSILGGIITKMGQETETVENSDLSRGPAIFQ
tara:strand:- start:30 stop:497 length:468 start_codon:yes stop_codon:yes gene_type:complete